LERGSKVADAVGVSDRVDLDDAPAAPRATATRHATWLMPPAEPM
jgi:hypothetical protein